MPITLEQVRAALMPDELDYIAAAAQLGPDALTHLETLVRGADLMLATKATYLASLIQDNRSAAILRMAAQSNYPEVRVAAATGARNLAPTEASDLLVPLLGDQDAGVRKTALTSTPVSATPTLRTSIQALATTDPEPAIRALSNQVLSRLPNPVK